MRLPSHLMAAGVAASALIATSAHALVVHFDPAMFDFYTSDPAFGPLFSPTGPVEIQPLDVPGSFGYVFPGVDWVGFGLDGETLTFGEGDPGGYQLVSPKPLWTVTPPAPNDRDYEVSFPQLTSDPRQTLEFTNPATGAQVLVTVSLQASVVPEPGTWALMLVGVGALGAGIRARRRSVAAA
jgi:PEP-CTERM motif